MTRVKYKIKHLLAKNELMFTFVRNVYLNLRRVKPNFSKERLNLSYAFSNHSKVSFSDEFRDTDIFADCERDQAIESEIKDYFEERTATLRASLFDLNKTGGKEKIFCRESFKQDFSDREILVYPDYSVVNPFQKLLYSELTVSYKNTVTGLFKALESESRVLHIHWTSKLLEESSLDEIKKHLSAYVAKGGNVFWFVHNYFPHVEKDNEIEKELRRFLASVCKKVILLSPSMMDQIVADFQISPDKLTLYPHGNYRNYYPKFKVVDIPDFHGVTVLFFGVVRKNKGVSETIEMLVNSFAYKKRQLRIVVAGEVVDKDTKRWFSSLASMGKGNFLLFSRVFSEDEIFGLFSKVDFLVLNYIDILNSGTCFLSLGVGVPVITSDMAIFNWLIENGGNGHVLKDFTHFDKIFYQLKVNKKLMSYLSYKFIKKYDWQNIKRNEALLCENIQREGKPFKVETEYYGDISGQVFAPVIKKEGAKIAIMTVNYNNHEDIIHLYYSLHASNYTSFELFIVDNGSLELSWKIMLQSFLDVTFIRSDKNGGYAYGVNLALKQAAEDFDYYCIINPDCEVSPDCLRKMVDSVGSKEVLSPVLARGLSQAERWFEKGIVNLQNPYFVSHEKADSNERVYSTDYISGAFMFFDKETKKVLGSLPEEFFLYFEETFWCQNSKSKGIKFNVLNEVLVYHKKNSDDGNFPRSYYLYYYVRNRYHFFKRTCGDRFNPSLILKDFESSWRTRIKGEKNPRLSYLFDKIVDIAWKDAENGVYGKVSYQILQEYDELLKTEYAF